VARVEFFIGSTLLATVPQAPYAYNWMNVAAGSYTITAKATDDRGAVTLSDPVAVNVTATPGAAQVYYIDSDHLNTPRVITDANNNIVWQWDNSDPFGGNVPQEDPGNTGTRLEFNLRFPGQYFDKETGLHYNYFRTYDPAGGIFTTSDPMGLLAGINTYAYVGGNPISFVDPTGLIKHHTGKTIQCGKNCTIRIDTTFDERTGVATRHLHWDCRGDTGSCGETGNKSHGGSWKDAPEQVKQCARQHGFNGAPASDSSSKEIWGAIGVGALVVGGILIAPEITIPTLVIGGALAQ
jgi:RHS repeat-associated protein